MTYYEILEISENASPEVICMAYKTLCQKYHPDVYVGDKNFAEYQIKKINEAYATLSNYAKRREYDDFLNKNKQEKSTSIIRNNDNIRDVKNQRFKIKPFPVVIILSILLVVSLLVYFVVIPYKEHTEYKKSLSAKVGSYIEFGSYEQDGNYNNGPESIEWLVLEKTADKVLLISRYGLDCVPFSKEWVDDATWETSNLRNWLNNTFYNNAFDDVEKRYILETIVENYDYTHVSTGEEWTTDDGYTFSPSTQQKVTKRPTNDFLYVFSNDEVEKYFPTSKSRKAKPTIFAKNMGADTHYGDGNHAYWWLRTNPDMNKNHSMVSGKGGISTNGLPVNCVSVTVRPVMWVDIS